MIEVFIVLLVFCVVAVVAVNVVRVALGVATVVIHFFPHHRLAFLGTSYGS